MATSLTHKYIPKTEQTEENLFIEEYYSNTDTKIYIEGVEQTEIAYINYSLQEQLKPLYGYASNTFDDVAIGNRIVTGMLKTPINNVELNSNEEDIKKRAKKKNSGYVSPDILDYNQSEQESVDNQEWIGNTEKYNDPPNSNQEDDVTYEYRTKLISLGYDLDYNSSNDELMSIIKQFQKKHKIREDGDLNYRTKEKIDEELSKQNSKNTVTLPKGTKIYSKPNSSSSVIKVLTEDTKVYVMDVFEGDWAYIMTEDGIEGCIDINCDSDVKEAIKKMKF